QGLQKNQEITFLSDGDDKLRELQVEMSPKATHILDWFHLTMKLTGLGQYGNGLVQCEAVLGEAIRDKIERLKWSVWRPNSSSPVTQPCGTCSPHASSISKHCSCRVWERTSG